MKLNGHIINIVFLSLRKVLYIYLNYIGMFLNKQYAILKKKLSLIYHIY